MQWPSDHPALTDPYLAEWADGADEIWPDAEVVAVLRHVPGRRVASLVCNDGRLAVLKVFASPRARGNHRRLERLAGSSIGDRLPSPIGVGRDGRVGIVSYLPGTPLQELSDSRFVATTPKVGELLARLHGLPMTLDRQWTIDDELAQLGRQATDLIGSLRGQLDSLAPSRHEALVVAHRDFHPKQVVVEGGQVFFIDLDDAAMAPAALDVGNFIAHLHVMWLTGLRSAETVEAATDGFLAGYGSPPATTEAWTLLALARLGGLAESRHHDPRAAAVIMSEVDRRLLVADARAAAESIGFQIRGRSIDLNPRHPDRPVTRFATIGGDVVIKTFPRADDASLTYQRMTDLWVGPLGQRDGSPRPLGLVRRHVVMESLPGGPLAIRGELPESETPAVASLLACLHATPVRGLPVRDVTSVLRSLRRKLAGIDFERERFRRVVEAMVGSLPASSGLVTGHGDFSPRNVMNGPSGLRLIDFDRLQLTAPSRDVTYWGAWIWVTSLMREGLGDWTEGDRLLVEYELATGRLISTAEVAFHRIAALVRMAHGWSALAGRPEVVAIIAEEAERQSEFVTGTAARYCS